MADFNLLDIPPTTTSNSLDEVHIVRHNQDYRMKTALLSASGNNTTGNAILEGGVIWLGTLDYYVWANSYIINSVTYNAQISATVTLNDGDATNGRFDVFTVEVNNDVPSIVVVEGTPDASPVKPTLDLTKQVEVSFRLVAALETTDPITQIDLIYDENVGATAEWNNTTLTTGGDLNDATSPYTGVKRFATPATSDDSVSWTDTSSHTYNGNDTLNFAIKIDIKKQTKIQIKLIDSATGDYWLKTLYPNNLTFDNNANWNLVQVQLDSFAPSSRNATSYDRLEITFKNSNDIKLDWINIQSVIEQPNGINTYLQLTDTDNDYAGKVGYVPTVNFNENALELAEVGVAIQTVKASLSSIALQVLHTSTSTLIISPSSGKYLKIIDIDFVYNFNSVSYNSSVVLTIKRGGVFGAQIGLISDLGQIVSTFNKIDLTAGDVQLNFVEGLGVEISAASTLGAGDGTLDIFITYEEITL